ncbi:MAG TPA: hypothetical protein VF614_06465 [Chthoniobacteraceae bacterium]|jgi:hypothetical protein
MKRRITIIAVLSLLGAAAVFLFGPSLLHERLRASTPASTLKSRQAEWSRLVQVEPQALNGPNRVAFARYSASAFRWFRVRGMTDPTCDNTSLAGEWRELLFYFRGDHDVPRPRELSMNKDVQARL